MSLRAISRLCAFSCCFALAIPVVAQSQRPQIRGPVEETATVRIPRSHHPLATAANDVGRASGELPMDRIQLILTISADQQAQLEQLLRDQQDPASGEYHRWLTPEQFGERFGPAQQDIDAVSAWLASRGFHDVTVAAGRRTIEFSGSAQQVEGAFHTQIHRYLVNGQEHIANATDIAIPSALAPVVGGVVSLHNFQRRPLHRVLAGPLTNLSGGAHALSPYDFATIYNVAPLWTAGFDGTGQTVAIAGRTNIKMTDVATFRSTFGLPGNNTQIVLNGTDPGIVSTGEETEADLDVEWSGGVAKGATVKFVVSKTTSSSDGVDLSNSYIVNNNLAAAMSVSFGNCEADIGSDNQFYNNLWSQAASQGISVFVSSGDSGSAGCDASDSTAATQGLAVNGLGSTPFNVAVGGTEFNDSASPSTYWNAGNDSHLSSAKGYIPEMVWNESGSSGLWSGGGGVSIVYGRPSWQTGDGVPMFDPGTTNQQHRLVPDVSLNAAGHDGYLIYQEGGLYLVGGTSASSPSMAGIMTIVDQHSGGRNGNPNPQFYSLAASFPSVYHDVTTGTNEVPCQIGTPACSTGLMSGFAATSGYDVASGLGSVDANALAANWGTGGPAAPAIQSLSPNPMTASASVQTLTINGSNFQLGASVTVGTASFSGSAVQFVSSSQLTVPVTETSAGGFGVTVTNPGGAISNPATLTVNSSQVLPTISSLFPNPMTASGTGQSLVIMGSNFKAGATVKVGTTTFSGSQVIFYNSSLLAATVTEAAGGTFAVTVTNPGGGASASANLTVNGPGAPAPSVNSLSPNPMTASASTQTLTVSGSNFQSGASVTVGSSTFSGSAVTFVSQTQLKVSVTENTAGTFGVTVTNPSGSLSNSATLTVNAVPLTPSISSLSPNPMTASASAQTLTVNGSNFQSGATVKVGTTTFSGAAVTFVSATQLNVSLTESGAGTFGVTVTNPGGSGSNSVTLTVNAAPAPSINSLSPNPMTASSSAQTLTVNGSNFQSGASVTVGTSTFSGAAVTFVSSGQLNVSVTENGAGTFGVTVTNPGGSGSNSVPLTVNAAPVTPSVTSVSPNPMTASASAQTLTVSGSNFQSGVSVTVGTSTFSGAAVTFVSAAQLNVSVTENTAGTFGVTVTNPGGTISNSVPLTVNAAPVTPSITSLSPNPMTASASAQTLTVSGNSFQSGATVKVGTATFGGAAVTFVSAAQLNVSLTENASGAFGVTVTNPGGSASNSVTLTVNPAPVTPSIGSLSPNPMTASASAQTLTVSGSNFQSGASVTVGTSVFSGAAVTFVSAAQLNVSLTENAGGTFGVTVTNPGGSASNSVTLTVNPAPVTPSIGSLSPNPMTASASAQTLTVNGSNFQSGASVTVGTSVFSGAAVTFISAGQLNVSLTENASGAFGVTVTNPGGSASSSVTLTVNPAPVTPSIGSLSPNPMTASASTQTLTVNGSGFQPGATVTVGSATFGAGSVAFVSASQLNVTVTEASAASLAVTVTNPGGTASNSVTLVVNGSGTGLAISSLTPNPMTASSSPQTLTINGSGFQPGATVTVGSSAYTGASVTYVSATRLKVTVTQAVAGSFAVVVLNTGWRTSNLVMLTVQ